MTTKRYNHFLWLRDQLVLENPGCLVPPIPEKDNIKGTLEKVSGGSTPSTLVAYRKRALRKFLVRVGAHSKLQGSDLLMDFLQLSDEEFSKRMKQPSRETTEIVSISAAQRVTSALSAAHASTPDFEKWDTTMQYFEKFESLLGEMREKMNRLMHAYLTSGKTMKDIGFAYSEVKEVEGAKGISTGAARSAAEGMGEFSEQLTKLDTLYEGHSYEMCVHVAESVTYYQGMCGAVLYAIRRLLKLQNTRDLLQEEHKRVSAKPDPQSKEKADKLWTQFEEAQSRAKQISEDLTEELARFQRDKSYDFKSILTTHVALTKDLGKTQGEKWTQWLSHARE